MKLKHTLILLLLSLYLMSDFVSAAKPERGNETPVVVAAATRQNLAPLTWVSGTVISRNDAKLASEVNGQIKSVAEAGKIIAVGEVIARIDDTFVKLKIEELKSAVEREQAQLQFLTQEVNRLRRLAKQNNAAITKLEQTQADKTIAKSGLNIARTRLETAKEELARHIIRAPFTGVVAERLKQPGERADIGDAIVRLIDHKSLEVQARIPLFAINYIDENTPLDMRIGDDDSQILQGNVRTLVPIGDGRSRLLDLRIDFQNKWWRVGQPVRVAVPTAKSREVLAIPRDALVLRRDGVVVFKVNRDNKAEKVPVIVGIADGALVEVTGNLIDGDKVVVRGGERLRPDQAVSIINSEN